MRSLAIRIDRDTAATRWRGERMDYELGVWVLCKQANHARSARARSFLEDVSAETSIASQRRTGAPVIPARPRKSIALERARPPLCLALALGF